MAEGSASAILFFRGRPISALAILLWIRYDKVWIISETRFIIGFRAKAGGRQQLGCGAVGQKGVCK